MRKGITPIIAVIILLLITVALAGMAWAFLNNYFVGLTGKTVSVVDYSCIGGNRAQIIIRNSGTDTINLAGTGCQTSGITGTTFTCGDMTITNTNGQMAGGNLSVATITKGANVIFTSNCTTGTSCIYRIVTSSAGIGTNPNVATVNC